MGDSRRTSFSSHHEIKPFGAPHFFPFMPFLSAHPISFKVRLFYRRLHHTKRRRRRNGNGIFNKNSGGVRIDILWNKRRIGNSISSSFMNHVSHDHHTMTGIKYHKQKRFIILSFRFTFAFIFSSSAWSSCTMTFLPFFLLSPLFHAISSSRALLILSPSPPFNPPPEFLFSRITFYYR